MGQAGFRSAILDLAATLPSSKVNGAIVVDWGSEHPAWKTSSYPKELIDQINRDIGKHPLANFYQGGLDSKEDYQVLAEKLMEGVELRTRALQYVLNSEDFDFVFCNYSEPHWAGHLFWHLHDEQHPEHAPEYAAYCGDVILQVYKACDRAIGEFVEDFPDENLLVISNIGIGPHSGGDMMAPEILDKLGMSGEKKSVSPVRRFVGNLLPGGTGTRVYCLRQDLHFRPGRHSHLGGVSPEAFEMASF